MTLQLIIDSKFNSAGVREAENAVKKMAQDIRQQLESSGGSTDLFIDQFRMDNFGDTSVLKQRIAETERYAQALRSQAQAAYESNNALQGDKLLQLSNTIQGTANNMRSLTDATEKNVSASEKQGGTFDLINNKFAKFSFNLFVLQGTINTITRLLGQMFNTLMEGASIADRSNSFNTLLENAGVNAEAMRSQLMQASQGVVTLDAAMRPTIQLMKAGVPEVANMSGKLLQMAVASAKLSGDLSQTEHIYTTL